MNPETCPKLTRPAPGDWKGAAEILQNGLRLPYQQTWNDPVDETFRPGEVLLGHDGHRVILLASLTDDDIFSTSTANGQHLYQLGDVFEIFFRDPSTPEYYELHCSPGGHNFQLRWPSAEEYFSKQARVADAIIMDPLFDYWVRTTPEGWEVMAELEASRFFGCEDLSGRDWLMSFSRYDYDSHGSKPVLSSTSPHRPLKSYHRQDFWHSIHFAKDQDPKTQGGKS
jgi:hypothetical protein